MNNIQNCFGEHTSLTISKKEGRYGAILWAEDTGGRSASQWAIGHGSTMEEALGDLDRRLTGLTYDDVMRT